MTHIPATLVELLQLRAAEQPDRRAYGFLLEGDTEEAHLSYHALETRARAIAATLQAHHAMGERALLLYPPGLDYIAAFMGCLYAGVIAVPAYPPRFHRPMLRLRTIVADAEARFALTTSDLFAAVERRFAQAPDLETLHWVPTDTLTEAAASAWQAPPITPQSLAFLQYTSGSTATPKGVMLTHSNLLHNLKLIAHAFQHTTESRGVIWLPPYHDMGLIGGILQPLYVGFPVTLMAPVAFLQRPLRWLQAISRTRATSSGGPNFAYDLCVSQISVEDRATLDLSSWQVAFNGAEPIHAETIARFTEAFAPYGFRREAFYPCYGLAEATLIVSGGLPQALPVLQAVDATALEQHRVEPVSSDGGAGRTLVGCGQTLPDQEIVIVAPQGGARCAPNEVGEIWVRGPSVAQGYWQRADESAHTFQASLADDETRPFLRTGDLGFLWEGQLYITGRLKDLIIIRGRNHYPQDIEWTVEQSHPALRPGSGAAFAVEVNGAERLVVVQEVERRYRTLDVDEVAGIIRQAVAAQHDIHLYAVVLLKPGTIPKTSSGKIQRHACRVGFLTGSLDVVGSSMLREGGAPSVQVTLTREMLLTAAPREREGLLSAYLQAQVAGVLQVAHSRLDPLQPLSTLGIDSLMAVELKNSLETSLGVRVSMTSFLEGQSVAQLATTLLEQLATPELLADGSPSSANGHASGNGQGALGRLVPLGPQGRWASICRRKGSGRSGSCTSWRLRAALIRLRRWSGFGTILILAPCGARCRFWWSATHCCGRALGLQKGRRACRCWSMLRCPSGWKTPLLGMRRRSWHG